MESWVRLRKAPFRSLGHKSGRGACEGRHSDRPFQPPSEFRSQEWSLWPGLSSLPRNGHAFREDRTWRWRLITPQDTGLHIVTGDSEVCLQVRHESCSMWPVMVESMGGLGPPIAQSKLLLPDVDLALIIPITNHEVRSECHARTEACLASRGRVDTNQQ